MGRGRLVCALVALSACTEDDQLSVQRIPNPPYMPGSTIGFNAHAYDGVEIWGLAMESIWRTRSLSWYFNEDAGIDVRGVTMTWDAPGKRLLVANTEGVWQSTPDHVITQVFARPNDELPRHVFGASGDKIWVLANSLSNRDIKLMSIDANGTPTIAHGGATVVDLEPAPQGLQLADGRLLIVHDPVASAGAWIANTDGTLTPVPCNPACGVQPPLQIGDDGKVYGELEDGLAELDLTTGALGPLRVDFNWPLLGRDVPTKSAYMGISGRPQILHDGRVYMLASKAVGNDGTSTLALLVTTLDGNAWREVQEITGTFKLEHDTNTALWLSGGSDGVSFARISL